MSIPNNKNDDSTAKSKRRYLGGIGSGVNITRKFCERSRDFTRVSSAGKAQKGAMMEQVLKLLGYKEKTANAIEAIRRACLLNNEASERLEKVKATLNGEYTWFKDNDIHKGEGVDGSTF